MTSEGPESAALRMDYVRFCTDSPSMASLLLERHDSQTGLNSEFRSYSVSESRGNSFCKRDISETFSVFSIPQTFDHEKLPLGSLGKNDSLMKISLATATSSNDLFPFSSFFQAASPCPRRSSPSKCVGSASMGRSGPRSVSVQPWRPGRSVQMSSGQTFRRSCRIFAEKEACATRSSTRHRMERNWRTCVAPTA